MTAHSASPPPSGPDDIDLTLLDRYWSGETSAEESATLEARFAAHPEWHARYSQLRRGVMNDQWNDLSTADLDRTITRAFKTTGLSVTTPPTQSAHQTTQRSIRRLWPHAIATCALTLTVLVIGWQSGTHRVNTRMSGQKSIYTTPNGQRANITLPDGSEVTLNVGSRLEVPADFALGTRTVNLDGEAIFTVTHNKGTPFTVTAGPSTTRVLGTRFVVRHYATDTLATVAVQNGKVSVGSTILTASEQVQVSTNTITTPQRTNPGQFSFATGRLMINGKPLRDAIPDLERWYDTKIHLATPALGDRRLTLESSAGTLVDLTAILELALDIRVVREGRSMTLYHR